MNREMIPVFHCRQRLDCSRVVDLNIVLEDLHQSTHDNLNKKELGQDPLEAILVIFGRRALIFFV